MSGSFDATVCIWDARTSKIVAGPLKGHANPVTSVAFSPDGEHIASGSTDRTIRIWSTRTGKLATAPLEGHMDEVTSVSFSSDGHHMVSGSYDKTVRVFAIHASIFFPSVQGYGRNSRLENGWMQNSPTELLFWVPPAYRAELWRPFSTLVIGQQSARLDLSQFVHGDDWARCCNPTQLAVQYI